MVIMAFLSSFFLGSSQQDSDLMSAYVQNWKTYVPVSRQRKGFWRNEGRVKDDSE